jgi:putative membrane protein insertion efficiency factor
MTVASVRERSVPTGTDPCRADAPRSGPARILLALIHAYQLARSGRPTGCRYLPSCSEYAVQAIDGHGALRGTGLALRRIGRCGPWGGHGLDPVPDRMLP